MNNIPVFKLEKCYSDWLKLFAAILVAVSHYSTVIVINNQWSDSSFLRLLCQGGNIGVAIFFFFSGYGLMESDRRIHLNFKEFIRKRFLKIYLPIFSISLIWIPVYWLVMHESPGFSDLGIFIYDLLWGWRDPVLWFVKMLIPLYGIFLLYSYYINKKEETLASAVLLLGVTLVTLLAFYCEYPYINIPLFAIGVISSRYNSVSFKGIPYCFLGLSVLAIIYTSLYLFTGSTKAAHGVINTLILAISLALITNLQKTQFATPQLVPFAISAIYIIYLVHYKVLILMVAKLGHIPLWSWALVTALTVIVFTHIKVCLKI